MNKITHTLAVVAVLALLTGCGNVKPSAPIDTDTPPPHTLEQAAPFDLPPMPPVSPHPIATDFSR